MLTHSLHCSVCDRYAQTRKSWLIHLLQTKHQVRARKRVLTWNKKVKSCALVVFGESSVSNFEILDYFSRGFNIVTDLVLFPEKPNVGIYQFKTRKSLNKILRMTQAKREVRINNQLVQMRKASSFLDLEWKCLVNNFCKSEEQENSLQVDEYDDESESSNSSSGSLNQETKSFLKDIITSPTPSNLLLAYKVIRQRVKIPDKEYRKIIKIQTQLQEIFSSIYPNSRIFFIRHRYLKLSFDQKDDLVFLVDGYGHLSGCENLKLEHNIQLQAVEEIIGSNHAKLRLPCKQLHGKKAQEMEAVGFGVRFKHQGLLFNITTHPDLKVEAQSCSLLRYLCKFDQRVSRLLIMVCYWGLVNELNFSALKWDINYPRHIPGPTVMQWLVILVLCQTKVIPTPGEIMNQSGKPFKVDCRGTDIGFVEDNDFIKRWKMSRSSMDSSSDDFMWSVLELAETFFSTISGLTRESWVLNSRDGEILRKGDISNRAELWLITKLSRREVTIITQIYGKSSKGTLIFLHPFWPENHFCFAANVFVQTVSPCMESVAFKIRQLLVSRRNANYPTKIDFESLFKVT